MRKTICALIFGLSVFACENGASVVDRPNSSTGASETLFRFELAPQMNGHLFRSGDYFFYVMCMGLNSRTRFENDPPWWNAQVRFGLSLEKLKIDSLRLDMVQPGHWNTHYGKDEWRQNSPSATPIRDIKTITINRTEGSACWLLRTKEF